MSRKSLLMLMFAIGIIMKSAAFTHPLSDSPDPGLGGPPRIAKRLSDPVHSLVTVALC
jgi:hypothetical protein